MNGYLRAVLKFAVDLIRQFRTTLWNFNTGKQHQLKLLTNHSYKFSHFGDITKMLFVNQHLVSRKKSFEYEALELFESLIKDGDVFFDIGANVGIYSMIASSKIGNSGIIHAFEPAKNTAKALRKNIEINKLDNVSLNEIALSDSNGYIQMVESDKFDKDVFYDAFLHIKKVEKGEIESKKLDTFVEENKIKKVDFIKIDVEGAELLCFKGALETLKNYKPIILFEAFEEYCNRYDYTIMDLLVFLNGLGYTAKQLNEYQWLATCSKTNHEN